jgi:lysozyme family protein
MSATMTTLDRFLALIHEVEGDKLDLTRADPGNWTGGRIGKGILRGSKCGISAAAYPAIDIASLTDEQIAFLIEHDYLDHICFNQLPAQIAIMTGDGAYNQGLGASIRILQAALGIEQDGVVGTETVAVAARHDNDADLVALDIGARRGLRYAETSGVPTFGLGWFRRLFTAYRAATATA